MARTLSLSDDVLSDDLLLLIFERLPAVALGRLAAAHRRWGALVADVAHRRAGGAGGEGAVRDALIDARRAAFRLAPAPCWLRAMATIEALEASVGERPSSSWRADWGRGDPDEEGDEEAEGAAAGVRSRRSPLSQPGAIERYSCKFAWALELRELAWPRDHADALALLGTFATADVARSVRARSSAHAASTWVLCDALTQAAARQMRLARTLTYACLTGRGGLATDDPVWAALLAEDPACGVTFSTSTVALAASSELQAAVVLRSAPSARTLAAAHLVGVVCFEPRPPLHGGFRALVDVGSGRTALPPFAHVRLVAVDEPGEWRLSEMDAPAPCRRYTVHVDW